ncbi:MAG TPA: outer membrane lipoprotein-sorting protein, partial [Gammaproteobacteria bacterium]|nr:outer membrane lipoprotein-sorting protein [Gammaproteobacteria bacterium]
MDKRNIASRILASALLLALSGAAYAETAQEIVAKTDEVRNPKQPFHTTTTLTAYVSGAERDQTTLAVYSKVDPSNGQFRNLVQYVDPPRDAGKRVLLGEGALWFYDPASKT